jgi:PHD/YefM family antitoxin component YafN of YafNO toxin-antitoxin module
MRNGNRGGSAMEEVNALKIRNNLGEILDRLDDKGEPILISKGRKIRAVLVTPEQFEKRFLDYKTREDKERLLDSLKRLRKKKKGKQSSLSLLRKLRGYEK